MSRLAVVSLLAVFSLQLAGCPQGESTSETDASSRTVPGQGAPTEGGEVLDDPAFSLVLPAGLTLKEQDTAHPGVTYWRYYEDAAGLHGISVQVNRPSNWGTTSFEEVAFRVKGAIQSATGDFLLAARVAASSYFGFESEGAVGLLPDGSTLVVQLGSLNLTGVDELVATSLFTSIDLKNTDGRALEQRWRDTSPVILTKTNTGLTVLSDLSVWSLYGDKTSAEASEVASWAPADAVFPQVLFTDNGVEHGELVHVGHWRPVDAFKVGVAADATIREVRDGSVSLSDETAWIVGSHSGGWNVGDRVLRVQDRSVLSLIHASTGRVAAGPQQAIIGPGFQLALPQETLEEVTNLAAPAPASYWRVFYNKSSNRYYAVGVVRPEAAGGSAPIEQFSTRVRGAVTSSSGDLLLLARYWAGGFEGFEADVSIGLLADGRILYVFLVANDISATEELAELSLFTSISLLDTNGRSLEEQISAAAPAAIVRASNGMLVLEDLSVWTLSFSATPAETQEFNHWQPGDKFVLQAYREQYAYEDTYELLHVGHWFPVEVESDTTASDRTIAAIIGDDSIRLSDGSLWKFSNIVPPDWNLGDRVLRVREKYSHLSEWLIHVESGQAVKLFI